MTSKVQSALEEPRQIKIAYMAFLTLMIACGLAARAVGLLPLQ